MRIQRIRLILTILFCLQNFTVNLFSQPANKIDSLKLRFKNGQNDTSKIWILHEISFFYIYTNPDTAFYYAQTGLELARKGNYDRGIIRSLNDLGNVFWNTGNYPRALETYLSALKLSEKINDNEMMALCYANLGIVYIDLDEPREAVNYTLKALKYDSSINHKFHLMIENMNLGEAFYNIDLDSSLLYQNTAYQLSVKLKDEKYTGRILKNLGNIQLRLNTISLGIPYFLLSVPILERIKDYRGLNQTFLGIVNYYKAINKPDSVIHYSNKALNAAIAGNYSLGVLKSIKILSAEYKLRNKDSAIKYFELLNLTTDSIFGVQKTRELQSISINEKLRQSEIKREEDKRKNERRITIQLFTIFLFIFLPIIFIVVVIVKKIKSKYFANLGILTILLVFEYINLLIHPFVDNLTDHSPILMLLIMVIIASILVPLHHKIGIWIKGKITKRRYRKSNTKN